MKNKNYHTAGTGTKSNRKTVEAEPKTIPLTQKHERSLSWLGTGTSIKVAAFKQGLWT